MTPDVLETLRQVLKQMNRGMVVLWRLGFGRFAEVWPRGFGRILVIEHVGRNTGAAYRSPVNFTRFGDDLYCVAAFGRRTDWYRNTLAQQRVVVWLPDGRWEVTIEDASAHPQRLELMRRVLLDSGFAAPLFGLHPRRISDDELATATDGYMLLRLHPERPLAPGTGPSDLVWIWKPAVMTAAAGYVLHIIRARTAAT